MIFRLWAIYGFEGGGVFRDLPRPGGFESAVELENKC